MAVQYANGFESGYNPTNQIVTDANTGRYALKIANGQSEQCQFRSNNLYFGLYISLYVKADFSTSFSLKVLSNSSVYEEISFSINGAGTATINIRDSGGQILSTAVTRMMVNEWVNLMILRNRGFNTVLWINGSQIRLNTGMLSGTTIIDSFQIVSNVGDVLVDDVVVVDRDFNFVVPMRIFPISIEMAKTNTYSIANTDSPIVAVDYNNGFDPYTKLYGNGQAGFVFEKLRPDSSIVGNFIVRTLNASIESVENIITTPYPYFVIANVVGDNISGGLATSISVRGLSSFSSNIAGQSGRKNYTTYYGTNGIVEGETPWTKYDGMEVSINSSGGDILGLSVCLACFVSSKKRVEGGGGGFDLEFTANLWDKIAWIRTNIKTREESQWTQTWIAVRAYNSNSKNWIGVEVYSATESQWGANWGGQIISFAYPYPQLSEYNVRVVFTQKHITVYVNGRWIVSVPLRYVKFNPVTKVWIGTDSTGGMTFSNVVLNDLHDWREAIYIDYEQSGQSAISSILGERPVEITPRANGAVGFYANVNGLNPIAIKNIRTHNITEQTSTGGSDALVYADVVSSVVDESYLREYGFMTRVMKLSTLESGAIKAARNLLEKANRQAVIHEVTARADLRLEVGDVARVAYNTVGVEQNVTYDIIIKDLSINLASDGMKMRFAGESIRST